MTTIGVYSPFLLFKQSLALIRSSYAIMHLVLANHDHSRQRRLLTGYIALQRIYSRSLFNSTTPAFDRRPTTPTYKAGAFSCRHMSAMTADGH